MPVLKLIPVLGRKNDVPQNDLSLFQFLEGNQAAALTHDVGGINFDLRRKRNACSKAEGSIQWSAAATAEATKCLGLFMLYDGVNRDYLYFDNGVFNVYNSSLVPYEGILNFDGGTDEIVVGETITDGVTSSTAVVVAVTVTGGSWVGDDAEGTLHLNSISGNFDDDSAITGDIAGVAVVNGDLVAASFATDNKDLYSIIRVGSHAVWADRAEHTPYCWKNGDDYPSKLITAGTEFKFRILQYFMTRIVGLYSDQTNGDIDVRWSGSLPTPGTSCEFTAASQLYIPNDDPIVGARLMGTDKLFIYSENSIHQLVYYPDYTTPFRAQTIVPNNAGGVNHHSIVPAANAHFLFNRKYGFCMYNGGFEFPTGRPISDNIEADIAAIDSDYFDLIVGAFLPIQQKIAWVVPAAGSTTPSQLWLYDLRTGQWTFEDKAMRYLSSWQLYSSYTWTNLIADTGGAWAGAGSNPWGSYLVGLEKLVYSNTDGQLYYQSGESLPAGNLDGYRIEPIMDFGNPAMKKLIKEIWLEFSGSGSFEVDISHRSGNTVGEVLDNTWTALGSISANNPAVPALRGIAKSAKYHQLRWGTNENNEKFQVNGIVIKYANQGY